MVNEWKGYTHAKFYCKTKSRSKETPISQAPPKS